MKNEKNENNWDKGIDGPLVVRERPHWSKEAVFYAGRDCATPPPPQSIWKRKKNFFVSKQSTAAILSWLKIGISIQHYSFT